MAKAPRPGVTRRADDKKSAQRIAKVSFKGSDPLPLAIDSIPIAEKVRVRGETGLPYRAFWGNGQAVDVDSFTVLWWLARRANGERMLTFLEVAEEIDRHDSVVQVDFGLTVSDPDEDDDSPEG